MQQGGCFGSKDFLCFVELLPAQRGEPAEGPDGADKSPEKSAQYAVG